VATFLQGLSLVTNKFSGLTWDHPRGKNALIASAKQSYGLINWDLHSLEGFESAPIAEICNSYDLVVLDHPHLGEALTHGCLKPLATVFDAPFLAQMAKQTLGPSFDSYTMAGQQWALPLDSATQVMATRADLINGASLKNYSDVIEYSKATSTLAMCIAGPHAFLSFLSIACAIDPEMELREGDTCVPSQIAEEAMEILIQLVENSPEFAFGFNPIAMLEHMSTNDDISVCPLIYGYVNYASDSTPHPLTYQNAPYISNGTPGSIIGGTGIAISNKCEVSSELKEYLMWLMSENVQSHFIPDHDGQPSHKAAWGDARLNASFQNFYSNTTPTLAGGSIRPRYNGYIAFQSGASQFIREGLSQKLTAKHISAVLKEQFWKSKKDAT